MAVTRKPKPAPSLTTAPAVDVEALINKGGSVAPTSEPAVAAASKPVPVVLRVPPDVLARVDQLVEARRVKVPRHTWLHEAVVEKLEREAGAP